MDNLAYLKLEADSIKAAIDGEYVSFFSVNDISLKIFERLRSLGLNNYVLYFFVNDDEKPIRTDLPVRPIIEFGRSTPSALVIPYDAEKEKFMDLAIPYMDHQSRFILSGYGHVDYVDDLFNEVLKNSAVPSLANGYPECLAHIYQCLMNCSRLNLTGNIIEFGTFRGGTTLIISDIIRKLGEEWPIVTFDTFDGFPARRSPLDLYAHPDCVYRDKEFLEKIFDGRNISIVEGDIYHTSSRLQDEKLLLTFFDTDNYSATSNALPMVAENTEVGGAIIFDHFCSKGNFRYTIGERYAAKPLLSDNRFINLQGTGVFLKQRK